mmetsp:Transcript_12159/g.18790  ORF Transcript_12159/g.18790 Transcript_12159/m.18790 type:complete len:100 (-) Transcript_12159:4971-5270(-)
MSGVEFEVGFVDAGLLQVARLLLADAVLILGLQEPRRLLVRLDINWVLIMGAQQLNVNLLNGPILIFPTHRGNSTAHLAIRLPSHNSTGFSDSCVKEFS